MILASIPASESRKEDVMALMESSGIEHLGLQFTDLFGSMKCVYVHRDEVVAALNGRTMFDGSSVQGFATVERSELCLMPDLETIRFEAFRPEDQGVAFVYCDVLRANGEPSDSCQRTILKRVIGKAKELGYRLDVGIEGEFFLFETNEKGEPVHGLHDKAGYFDGGHSDRGERARMDIVTALKRQGFHIEAAHHEVAPGQHEIDFRYGEALAAADRWMTFRQVVKAVAHRHGLHASFLPKPFAGYNGNAMHCNQSLWNKAGENAFYDAGSSDGLSRVARHYIGGLLRHAKGMAAIANPIVNSYKRLKPGYEAPTHIAWSASNRSALIRIPSTRGAGTRVELRTPDPTANPYLVLAVMLAAGLEGIVSGIEPPAETNGDIARMSGEGRAAAGIESYPRDLHEAVQEMRRDALVRRTLGEHAFESYVSAKQAEADEFAEAVHSWEIENYLSVY